MKGPLLAAFFLLVPAAALAAGLNLGWGLACPSTAASSVNETDPCDRNDRTHMLVGSVRAPAGLTKVTAQEVTLLVQQELGWLTPWWRFDDETADSPGGCRGNTPTNPVGSISISTNFLGAPASTCRNYWGASATTGYIYRPDYFGSGTASLQTLTVRPAATAGPWTPGVEYYVIHVTIDTQHTAPDPSDPGLVFCPGCPNEVCIAFISCKLDQPPGTPNGDITVDTQDQRQFVGWQGGYCIPVSVRRATWGQIKSLYR